MRPIAPKPTPATRLMAASPARRLARLPPLERRLLLLLVSLGPEAARTRLDMLTGARREVLAPLVAEISALSSEERHALFAFDVPAPRPRSSALNARLARERPRLARLLASALVAKPGANPTPARDAAFGRSIDALAARWISEPR